MVGKERPVSSGVKLIDEAEVKKPEEEVTDLEILFILLRKGSLEVFPAQDARDGAITKTLKSRRRSFSATKRSR